VDNQVSIPTNPIQPDQTHASTFASSTPSTLEESDKDTLAGRVQKPIVSFLNRLRNNKKCAHRKNIRNVQPGQNKCSFFWCDPTSSSLH